MLRGDLTNVNPCLVGGNEEEWVRLFSVVPNDRTIGNEQKFTNRNFTRNTRNHFGYMASREPFQLTYFVNWLLQ